MAGHSGDKSYIYLLKNLYGIITSYYQNGWKPTGSEYLDSSLLLNVFSFLHVGVTNQGASITDRGVQGNIWEKKSISNIAAGAIYFRRNLINPNNANSTKGNGYSLRCVAKWSKNSIKFFSQLSSGDASDSICPKGWGIAKYEGDGSYPKLFESLYGVNIANYSLVLKHIEYNQNVSPDKIVIQNPQSFLYSGYYSTTINIGQLGRYFETRAITNQNTFTFHFSPSNIYTHGTPTKFDGFSLRCVAKFTIGEMDGLVSFPISPPNFLPVMLLTLSVPKGGEWQSMREIGVIKN